MLSRLIHRLMIATPLALAAACAGEPPPQREWAPSDHGQPARVDPDRVPTAAEAAAEQESPAEREARAASALFNVTCAGCHGRDGRGGGPARPPGAQMPDLTSSAYQSDRTDAQIAEAIAQGRGLMPAFDKQINPEGIRALVGHVRAFGSEAGGGAGAKPADSAPAAPAGAQTPQGAPAAAPAAPAAPNEPAAEQ